MKTIALLVITFSAFFATAQLQTTDIYFEKLSSEIKEDQLDKLNRLSALIKADSTTIQEISVYSDTLGTTELNFRLANERYANITKFLGIDPNATSFVVNIYGEEFPFVEADYSKELFRRVTIVHFVKEPPVIEEVIEEEIVEEIIEEEIIEEEPSALLTELEQFIQDTAAEEILVQLSILFVGDKDILMETSVQELDELYKFLSVNKHVTAHIRGHVCCKPNKKLSKARAYRVYDYLVDHSISKKRLSYKGYSNRAPYTKPEISEEDRQSNRRVDVIFKKCN